MNSLQEIAVEWETLPLDLRDPRKVAAGKTRAKSFTSEYQKAARAQVRRESLQEAGRRGYAHLLANRYGTRWEDEYENIWGEEDGGAWQFREEANDEGE